MKKKFAELFARFSTINVGLKAVVADENTYSTTNSGLP